MFDKPPKEINFSVECCNRPITYCQRSPGQSRRPRVDDKTFRRTSDRTRQSSRRRAYRNPNTPTNSQSEDALVSHGFRNSSILVEDVLKPQEYEEDSSVSSSGSSNASSETTHNSRRNRQSKIRNRSNNGYTLEKGVTRRKFHDTEALRSQYIAMDCEMVGIGDDGKTSALARVSLVDWHGQIVLDTYVKVYEPVTDLRTFVSGVTLDKIVPDSPCAMEYDECVDLVQKIINGKVLVGHGLKNDLEVLRISHPWYDIRDTTKYEPFMRAHGPILLPKKLKELAQEMLGLSIQASEAGHDSIEDAWSAMQLYKLVGPHWDQIMEFKLHKTWQIVGPQEVHEAYSEQSFFHGYSTYVACN